MARYHDAGIRPMHGGHHNTIRHACGTGLCGVAYRCCCHRLTLSSDPPIYGLACTSRVILVHERPLASALGRTRRWLCQLCGPVMHPSRTLSHDCTRLTYGRHGIGDVAAILVHPSRLCVPANSIILHTLHICTTLPLFVLAQRILPLYLCTILFKSFECRRDGVDTLGSSDPIP